MAGVADALAADEPLPILGLASTLLSAFDDGPSLGRPQESALPPPDDLWQSLFAADLIETSALLAGISGLAGDEMLRHRVRREIGSRAHVLPRWLLAMEEAEPVDGVFELRHVLGDGDNVMIGVRLPGGHELSAAVYIDHNLGTVVKDAYVVPGRLAELADMMRTTADDPDVTLTGLEPAEARARITEAIERGAMSFPPLETDSWPACRPFVEWAVSLLPTGGAGYVRPEWTDGDKQTLPSGSSPRRSAGAGRCRPSRPARLAVVVRHRLRTRRPVALEPGAVEILLADWIPRKIVADVAYLDQAPDLLRAFIRFSHAERGIRAELTEETLAAVDESSRSTGGGPHRPGRRARWPCWPHGRAGPRGAPGRRGRGPGTRRDVARALYPAVGGEAALSELDTLPCPPRRSTGRASRPTRGSARARCSCGSTRAAAR